VLFGKALNFAIQRVAYGFGGNWIEIPCDAVMTMTGVRSFF
jgi:hypothetical protein